MFRQHATPKDRSNELANWATRLLLVDADGTTEAVVLKILAVDLQWLNSKDCGKRVVGQRQQFMNNKECWRSKVTTQKKLLNDKGF
jgi:hypothetical protein